MPHLLLLLLPATAALAWQGWRTLRDGLDGWRLVALAVGAAALVWGAVGARGRVWPWPLRLPLALAAAALVWLSALELLLGRTTLLALGAFALLAGACVHATVLLALDRPAPGREAPVRLALRVGLFGSVLLLSLTGMEALLRALFPIALYEILPDDPRQGPCIVLRPDGQPRLRPDFRGAYYHPEFDGLRIETNAWGLRDDADEASPPAAGTASVVVVGDSFSFGTGVTLNETYQERLEARAAEIGDAPLRVYGAAVPGTGTVQQRSVLAELAPRVRPDVVIIGVFEGNDFQDNWSALHQRPPDGAPPQRVAPTSRLGKFLAGVRGYRFWRASSATVQRNRPWLDPLLERVGVIDPVVNTTLFLNEALRTEPPPSARAMRDALIEQLGLLRDLCTQHGAELVVLLIPDAIQTEPARFEDFARVQHGSFDRTAFHQSFAAALTAQGFRTVDTLASFEAEVAAGRSCFHQEGHWNAHGHARATELLVPVLREVFAAR